MDKDKLDAERYRRLAWLVEFGSWSVAYCEIIDSYGRTKDTYMDDKAGMDKLLDNQDVVFDAAACEAALTGIDP